MLSHHHVHPAQGGCDAYIEAREVGRPLVARLGGKALDERSRPALAQHVVGQGIQARQQLCGEDTQPFLTFKTCLRNPSVAVSMPPFSVRLRRNPGSGTERSIAMSNLTFVLSPDGVSV